MYGDYSAFYGLTDTPLVRYGEDVKLPKGEHNFQNVYTEMLLQISRDYSGIPDIRTLKKREIKFFYEGLRPELKNHTKPR